MKKHFSVVEPEEHILDEKDGKTFQYVPILQTLKQVLSNKNIQEKVLGEKRNSEMTLQYQTFHDGSHYQKTNFFSVEEDRISLILYIDDFEGCNPLGTSRKKHKVTSVYWVLGNIPTQDRSTLASIYLSILCKAEDTKQF